MDIMIYIAVFIAGMIAGCGVTLLIASVGREKEVMEAFNNGMEFERKKMEKERTKSA